MRESRGRKSRRVLKRVLNEVSLDVKPNRLRVDGFVVTKAIDVECEEAAVVIEPCEKVGLSCKAPRRWERTGRLSTWMWIREPTFDVEVDEGVACRKVAVDRDREAEAPSSQCSERKKQQLEEG